MSKITAIPGTTVWIVEHGTDRTGQPYSIGHQEQVAALSLGDNWVHAITTDGRRIAVDQSQPLAVPNLVPPPAGARIAEAWPLDGALHVAWHPVIAINLTSGCAVALHPDDGTDILSTAFTYPGCGKVAELHAILAAISTATTEHDDPEDRATLTRARTVILDRIAHELRRPYIHADELEACSTVP